MMFTRVEQFSEGVMLRFHLFIPLITQLPLYTDNEAIQTASYYDSSLVFITHLYLGPYLYKPVVSNLFSS